MAYPTTQVLEKQVDALAGRLAEIEAHFRLLVDRLGDEHLAKQFGDGTRKTIAATKHALERSEAVDALKAAREASLEAQALEKERRFKDLVSPREHPKVWRDVLSVIKKQINQYSFSAWFSDTSLEADNVSELTIGTGRQLDADWLAQKYLPLVRQALGETGRPGVTVTFVVRERN